MTPRIVGSLAVGLDSPGSQTIAGTDDWRVPFNTAAELRALGQPAALTDSRASFLDTFSSERGSWRSS
jgi:hypothetical protein